MRTTVCFYKDIVQTTARARAIMTFTTKAATLTSNRLNNQIVTNLKTCLTKPSNTSPINTTCSQISWARARKQAMDSDSTSFGALPLKDESRKDSRVQLCHIKGRLTAPVRCPCYPGLKRFISDRREGKSARAGGTEETARARTHSLTHTHCWKSAAHEYTLHLARA